MAGKKPQIGRSKSSQAADLRPAMCDTYQVLRQAHAGYQQALIVAQNSDLSSDRMLALKQKGRAYADAVAQHSNTVLDWLALVDTHKEEAIQFLRKAAPSD